MTSKYDSFWQSKLRTLRVLFEEAYAKGRSSEVRIEELRSYGRRKSWYGSLVLSRRELDSKGAHARSLGNLLRKSDFLDPYGETRFRVRISRNLELRIERLMGSITVDQKFAKTIPVQTVTIGDRINLGDLVLDTIERQFKVKLEREHFLDGMERTDGYGRMTGFHLFVELEIRRQTPANNVVKIWRYLEKRLRTNSILLHVFSGRYSAHRGRYANAVFLGKKMEETGLAKYVPVLIKAKPPKDSYGVFKITEEELQDVQSKISKAHETIMKE